MYLNQDFTKLTLKKSNYLINASYKLNLIEHRLIALLIAQIKDTDTEFQTCEISIKDFKTLFYENKGTDYWHFKATVNSICKREVVFQFHQNETIKTKWLSTAEYLNGSGIIKLCLSENLNLS